MPRAIWNNQVIAEAPIDSIQRVEENIYFPFSCVKQQYLRPSIQHTRCFWKGIASYYHVVVDGKVNEDAAWFYPEPSNMAAHIAGRVAFWHGVKIED